MTPNQVRHTLKSDVLHTSGEPKSPSVDPFPLHRFPLGGSESRGRYGTHSCCYFTSIVLFLPILLSYRLMLSLARGVRGKGLRILGCLAIPNTQGCTGIQWAWLRLICQETSCSCILSIVVNISLFLLFLSLSMCLSTRNSCRWGQLDQCPRNPKYVCGFFIRSFSVLTLRTKDLVLLRYLISYSNIFLTNLHFFPCLDNSYLFNCENGRR